jgi:hypothetical protein
LNSETKGVEHFEDITGFLANKKMESMSEIEKYI